MTESHQTIGNVVDRLISVEVRPKGLPTVSQLYEAAKKLEDGALTLGTAQALDDRVSEGDSVIITCGANVPPWFPRGETDGPFGAIVLARALALTYGANPIITTENRNLPPIESAANACGLNVVSYDDLRNSGNGVTAISYTENANEAEATAEEFLNEYNPKAVVAIEKLGPNEDGIINSLMGEDQTEKHAKIGPLFDLAHNRDILTVGFGDGGNEIGMAKIKDAVHEHIPRGEQVCTRIASDKLVVGGSSNWGAYGVAAMLAIMNNSPEAIHSPDDESRMLEHAMVNGLADSLTARPGMAVDGMNEEGLRGIVAILNNIVESRLSEVDRSIREFDRAREN